MADMKKIEIDEANETAERDIFLADVADVLDTYRDQMTEDGNGVIFAMVAGDEVVVRIFASPEVAYALARTTAEAAANAVRDIETQGEAVDTPSTDA